MKQALEKGAVWCYTFHMPTSHPRHSITETPALAAVLKPLRERMGEGTPSLSELVRKGAESTLLEIEAKDRANAIALETFVDRMREAPQPDLDEVHRIRHASRQP